VADPFVAEIRIFPFNFPPKGWAFCNGQIMPISQNTALFALLGTTYGGDGKSTFALPNLQGASAMHPGQGQGLSLRDLGEMGGADSVTLLESEMPAHNHTAFAVGVVSTTAAPSTQTALARSVNGSAYAAFAQGQGLQQLAFQALPIAGGSLPHNNLQPYLTLNYCIALQGVFPPRP
jgi:microcystin-dependent protein